MATSKQKVIIDIKVETDGRVVVVERVEYWEGGFVTGTLAAATTPKGRYIDVGDDVTAETELVRDVVNGNLHSPARKTERDRVKAEESARRNPGRQNPIG